MYTCWQRSLKVLFSSSMFLVYSIYYTLDSSITVTRVRDLVKLHKRLHSVLAGPCEKEVRSLCHSIS